MRSRPKCAMYRVVDIEEITTMLYDVNIFQRKILASLRVRALVCVDFFRCVCVCACVS